MKIEWKLSIGYPSAVVEDEMDIEDDCTDEEIEQMVSEAAHNYVEWSWRKVEEK